MMKPATKRTTMPLAAVLLAAFVAAPLLTTGTAGQGSLEPPGPPGSTFRSLSEVFDLATSIPGQQALFGGSSTTQADMRSELYAFIEADGNPLDGDVTFPNPESSTKVIGLQQQLSQPFDSATGAVGGGNQVFGPIVIRMNFEKNYPQLLKAMVEGESVDIEIQYFRPDLGHYSTLEITFSKITSIQQVIVPTPGGFSHALDVSISPGFGVSPTIKWRWEPDTIEYEFLFGGGA